jgi:fibronectin-binding autotransporter adhesin
VADSLRWAIEQSNASTSTANTIDISRAGQLNLSASLPLITQQVTIDNTSGGTFTINGRGRFQILPVGSPLTLDKIKLIQGAATNGGAIDVTRSAAVTLNTCSVSFCTASNDGGGLYSSGGTVTLDKSTLTSDRARQSGGGIWAGGNVQLNASVIQSNAAILGSGGGVWASGNVVEAGNRTMVDRTNLARVGGNTASLNGGGIYSESGTISVTLAHADDNLARSGDGGGIYDASGGIAINSGVQINGNIASHNSGGGIYALSGNVSVAANSEVNYNLAYFGGGGIFAANGNVNNSGEVDYNQAENGNGGGIKASSNVIVAGERTTGASGMLHTNVARVGGNIAHLNGGGIYTTHGTVSITIGHVDGNVARNADGGGIFESSGSVDVGSDAQVLGNVAVAASGGGIYAAAGKVTVAANGEVNSNFARVNGGGVVAVKGTAIVAGKANGNIAGDSGGGIYVGLGNVSIQNGGDVKGNDAHVDYSTTAASRVNSTEGGTGATPGSSETGSGGGSFSAIPASSSNRPGPYRGGGGIFVTRGNVTVSGGQVDSNQAFGPGGGICDPEGNVVLTAGAQVSLNSATAKGGGIFDEAGTTGSQGVQITDATVSSNTSDRGGGGVFVNFGAIRVLDSTIYGNIGYGPWGGGLNDSYQFGQVIITNSTVARNVGGYVGGGIYSGGTTTINNSTIVVNALSLDANYGFGAGIDSVSNTTINNTIVAGNILEPSAIADDISASTTTGSNNVMGDAATAGGLENGQNGNIVGINGEGTRPVSTIVSIPIAYHGGGLATYVLPPGSVALGRGNIALNPSTLGAYDERGPGFPRTTDGSMDIGALEEG